MEKYYNQQCYDESDTLKRYYWYDSSIPPCGETKTGKHFTAITLSPNDCPKNAVLVDICDGLDHICYKPVMMFPRRSGKTELSSKLIKAYMSSISGDVP